MCGWRIVARDLSLERKRGRTGVTEKKYGTTGGGGGGHGKSSFSFFFCFLPLFFFSPAVFGRTVFKASEAKSTRRLSRLGRSLITRVCCRVVFFCTGASALTKGRPNCVRLNSTGSRGRALAEVNEPQWRRRNEGDCARESVVTGGGRGKRWLKCGGAAGAGLAAAAQT